MVVLPTTLTAHEYETNLEKYYFPYLIISLMKIINN